MAKAATARGARARSPFEAMADTAQRLRPGDVERAARALAEERQSAQHDELWVERCLLALRANQSNVQGKSSAVSSALMHAHDQATQLLVEMNGRSAVPALLELLADRWAPHYDLVRLVGQLGDASNAAPLIRWYDAQPSRVASDPLASFVRDTLVAIGNEEVAAVLRAQLERPRTRHHEWTYRSALDGILAR